MRDYLKWHEAYDDSDSDLSWRLNQAQTYIRQALDRLTGPVTVLSLCAGDRRDVWGGPPQMLATGRQLFTFLQ
jgi:hypothetical protein